jgi:hypothetical protein
MLFTSAFQPSRAADNPWLWQIGLDDHKNAEFKLAPADWGKYQEDAFYLVGESDPRNDWPYVQPGPSDNWAGSRQHTAAILFSLKTAPAAGDCRLVVSLLDTHAGGPPQLRIQVNDRQFEKELPHGAGDDSLFGKPEKGAPFRFEITLPSDVLHVGDNTVQITTLSGSWMLYDWIGFQTPPGGELGTVAARSLVQSVNPVPALRETGGKPTQPVMLNIRHVPGPEAAQPVPGIVSLDGVEVGRFDLKSGRQTLELAVPAVETVTTRKLTVQAGGREIASTTLTLNPVRKLTVYILPHSHTDIGYTEIQSAIEKKQVNNLLEGIAAARRTAAYPEGARFVWNVEVGWAADLYLNRLNDSQRADFLDAVKKGQVVLNGMYLNELTGLCRPEELVRLFRFGTEIAEKTGVPVDSAMISDVPGYTWGTVTAMSQAGIKYFSTAPNYFDRIGTILREWENKPFYWVAPDGQSKVLTWIPFWGYAMSHVYGTLSPRFVDEFCRGLESRHYPYDIAYVRWSGHGDNAVPDPAICEFVKDWNTHYSWPRFIISGTGEAFRAFEQRYGNQLPLVRGDWTPYWEDGAGSSALETGLNRDSSDRLAQAETLFAMENPAAYPAGDFNDAWRNVLLYSEHTWGAWCSISEPERKDTVEQWAVKKSYADTADRQSRALMTRAVGAVSGASLEVVNTLSWPRAGLVTLPDAMPAGGGDCVLDSNGAALPVQKLANGERVFLAKNVPGLASARYSLGNGKADLQIPASASGHTLDNGILRVEVDPKTGGIASLICKATGENYVDASGGETLNDYRYLIGDDLKDVQRNGPVTITVSEAGPLVASLVIESDAPGCVKLRRELRLVAGQDYVEIINTVDKARLKARSYHDKDGKESLNFAFPFHVPDGEVLYDVPFGVVRPDADQMPSACKNWLTVARWADVSNARNGITWVTLDAPLIQLGGLTATLLNSQTNPDVWRKTIGRTQKIYSWAINNHWGTNYRAYQDGPIRFRFILRPHQAADPADATRFATGFSQPLIARAPGAQDLAQPLLQVSTPNVLVSALKPSDDGKAWIIRLYGASGKTESVTLRWGKTVPTALFLSDTSEHPVKQIGGSTVEVPGYGVLTLRAELK